MGVVESIVKFILSMLKALGLVTYLFFFFKKNTFKYREKKKRAMNNFIYIYGLEEEGK